MADGTRKPVHRLKKGDQVLTDALARTAAGVVAVVEIYSASGNETNRGLCQLDEGFFLTRGHPIRVGGGRWIRPKWQFECAETKAFPALFGLALDSGAHSVVIQGFEVATLVPAPVGVPLIDMPHKLAQYQFLTAIPGFAEGYVRVPAAEWSKFRPAGLDHRSQAEEEEAAWVSAEGSIVLDASGAATVSLAM